MYGATACTLTKTLECRLDGTYTRMLRAALNLSWRQHPTKQQLYGPIHLITSFLRKRIMCFAGHLSTLIPERDEWDRQSWLLL